METMNSEIENPNEKKYRVDGLINNCVEDLVSGVFPDSYAKGRGIALAALVIGTITDEEYSEYITRLVRARDIYDGKN